MLSCIIYRLVWSRNSRDILERLLYTCRYICLSLFQSQHSGFNLYQGFLRVLDISVSSRLTNSGNRSRRLQSPDLSDQQNYQEGTSRWVVKLSRNRSRMFAVQSEERHLPMSTGLLCLSKFLDARHYDESEVP